jgi:hypothetical protein
MLTTNLRICDGSKDPEKPTAINSSEAKAESESTGCDKLLAVSNDDRNSSRRKQKDE